MNDNTRNIVIFALVIIVCAGLVGFMLNNKEAPTLNEQTESIKLVQQQNVVLDTNELTLSIYGNLKSLNEIEIFPEVGGILKSNNFREGNQFRKGQVIALINNEELDNTIKSNKSKLLNQVAKLVADMTFDFPSEVPAWEAFLEGIQFDKKLPELPVVSDKKMKKYLAGKNIYNTYFSIQSLEGKMLKYKIIAPFNGVLVEAFVKPGTAVRMGQKIGKFIDPAQFELKANVALADADKLHVGETVNLHSNDIEGEWVGRISRINRTLSEASQNMAVFIHINDASLYNGMYLFGDINRGEAKGSIVINRNLLNGNELFTIVDGKLKSKKVTVLQIKEEEAIVSGLENGELILKEAIKGAYDGMKVRYN